MSKMFWMNIVIMVALLMFTGTYHLYKGWIYWLQVVCIAGLGMYFVRETTDNQLKKK